VDAVRLEVPTVAQGLMPAAVRPASESAEPGRRAYEAGGGRGSSAEALQAQPRGMQHGAMRSISSVACRRTPIRVRRPSLFEIHSGRSYRFAQLESRISKPCSTGTIGRSGELAQAG